MQHSDHNQPSIYWDIDWSIHIVTFSGSLWALETSKKLHWKWQS